MVERWLDRAEAEYARAFFLGAAEWSRDDVDQERQRIPHDVNELVADGKTDRLDHVSASLFRISESIPHRSSPSQ